MRKIIALILCTMFFAGSSNAELVIDKNLNPEMGDYLKFEVIGNTFGTAIGKSSFGDNYEGIESFVSQVEFTIVGFETIEVDGQKYDCHMEKRTMHFNYTIILKEDSYNPQPDGNRVNFSVSLEIKLWKNGSGLIKDTIKSEDITNIAQYWTESGEQKSVDQVIEEYVWHTKTQGASPDTLMVGNSWTMSEDLSTNSTISTRQNGGEWNIEKSGTEESVTTDYEVTAESKVITSLGTFDTLVIKSTDQGEGSGNYSIEYLDGKFFTVKGVLFENNDPILTMQLMDYRIKSLETNLLSDTESASELSNLSFILSICSIVFLATIRRA